jgi:hypothetical protein
MKTASILFLTLWSLATYSQRNAYWFFGDSAGLHFDGGVIPVPVLTAGLSTTEGCTTMSDEEGNLLFYSDGFNVWDRTGEIMPNGEELTFDEFGSGNPYHSITQSAISVPIPGQENRYYLIRNYGALRYSIVNMTLNGGLGDIEFGAKNISLGDSIHFSEKMNMIRHGNGVDWWLLTHKVFTDDAPMDADSAIFRYLVTKGGISYKGRQRIQNHSGVYSIAGELSFSPQGDKLAIAGLYSGVSVYSFDRCSGKVGSELLFDNRDCYGCAFSPDGKLLYVSVTYKRLLLQYELESWPLSNSVDTIFRNPDADYSISAIRLGPDDKLYFGIPYRVEPNFIVDTLVSNLCVVNSPNEISLNCDVDSLIVDLGGGGRRMKFGLPNIPNFDLGALEGSECDTLTGVGLNSGTTRNIFNVYPNPCSSQTNIESPSDFKGGYFSISYNGQVTTKGALSSLNQNIDISGLTPGVYLISFYDRNEFLLESKKLLIE